MVRSFKGRMIPLVLKRRLGIFYSKFKVFELAELQTPKKAKLKYKVEKKIKIKNNK